MPPPWPLPQTTLGIRWQERACQFSTSGRRAQARYRGGLGVDVDRLVVSDDLGVDHVVVGSGRRVDDFGSSAAFVVVMPPERAEKPLWGSPRNFLRLRGDIARRMRLDGFRGREGIMPLPQPRP